MRVHACPDCRCGELELDPLALIDVRAPGAELVLLVDRISLEEAKAKERATRARHAEEAST